MEDNIEKIMEMMQAMGQTVKDLSTEVRQIREEQREYRTEMENIKKENEKLNKENQNMKEVINDMEERIDRMENEKRRNNIVLQGKEMNITEPEKLRKAIENFMDQELQVKVKVKDVIKLGRKTCLVQLSNQEEKYEVMKNKSKLKQKIGEQIYVQDDLSKQDRYIQRQIRIRASEERNNGKLTKIGYRKLLVGSEEWKWNKEEQRLVKVANQAKN